MRFSVTIPAYKALYLSEAIESVLAQQYRDFELIIVNDASPEDLDAIVKRYNDPRIRYFKNEDNYGTVRLVETWNICLSHARGDYTLCMGDDDRLLPTCLSIYCKLIDKHPGLDVYHGWTQIIDGDGIPLKMQEPRPERESVYSMIWNRWKGRLQFIGDFLFRTATLRAHGGFYFLPMAWASDDISALIAAGRKGIANTQEPVFEYREHAQTISRTGNAETKIEAIKQEKIWYEDFLKDVPTDDIDKVYHASIKKELPHHFRLKIQNQIIDELGKRGLWRWLYWNKKRAHIGMSFSLMLWMLVVAAKNKVKSPQLL